MHKVKLRVMGFILFLLFNPSLDYFLIFDVLAYINTFVCETIQAINQNILPLYIDKFYIGKYKNVYMTLYACIFYA